MTNNAVQKNTENYGKFEDGNQISFNWFGEYVKDKIDFREECLPHMKYLIRQSLAATRWKLNTNNRKYTFELFGYDFIVDNDFNLWLIEVNTNPCIEESSELLKVLLWWMLEDMVKLTLDPLFPKPWMWRRRIEKVPEEK